MFTITLKHDQNLDTNFYTARTTVYVIVVLLYLLSVNTSIISSYHYTILVFADSILNGSTKIAPETYYRYFPIAVDVISTSEGFIAAHSAGYVFWASLSISISRFLTPGADREYFSAFRAMNFISALMGLLSMVFVEKIAKLYLNHREALLVAVFYAVGSIAWIYSAVAYTQSFSAPFVAIGTYYLFSYLRLRRLHYLTLSFISFSAATAADHFLIIVGVSSLLLVCYVDRAKLKSLVTSTIFYSTFLILTLLYYIWVVGKPLPTQSLYAAQLGYSVLDITRVVREYSLLEMLFGYKKGLPAVSPAVLLALLTSPLILLKVKTLERVEVFYSLTVFLSTAFMYASWYDWHGGLSYGPRLLYSLFPLLTTPTAIALRTQKRLAYVFVSLSLLGAISSAITVATDPLSCAYQDLARENLAQPLVCNLPLLYFNCRSPTLLGWFGATCSIAVLIFIATIVVVKGILLISIGSV